MKVKEAKNAVRKANKVFAIVRADNVGETFLEVTKKSALEWLDEYKTEPLCLCVRVRDNCVVIGV